MTSLVKQPGLYIIRNTVNSKVYVGSTVDIHKRWRTHKWRLNRGDHHSHHLQNAWDKYGKENFELIPLVIIPSYMHRSLESKLIKLYASNTKDKGYNMCSEWRSRLGMKASPETKKIMSERMRKWHETVNPELRRKWCQKAGKASKGFQGKHTEISKSKMSNSAIRRFADPEEREHQKARISDKYGKKVDVYKYYTGDFVGTYPSIRECARQLGIEQCRRGIIYVLNGQNKQVRGFTMSYKQGTEDSGKEVAL